MRCTVTCRGVPVAAFDLAQAEIDEPEAADEEDSTVLYVDADPLPGYEAIRADIALGWKARWQLGYLGPVSDPASDERGKAAMRRQDQIVGDLLLVDEAGTQVAAWINVLDGGEDGRTVPLQIFLDEAPAAVPARLPRPSAQAPDATPVNG